MLEGHYDDSRNVFQAGMAGPILAWSYYKPHTCSEWTEQMVSCREPIFRLIRGRAVLTTSNMSLGTRKYTQMQSRPSPNE